MSKKYKLSLNGIEYWDETYNNHKGSFEKTEEPCHIFVEPAKPFVYDKMICNYKDASGIKYLWTKETLGTRLREYKDYIVIEPSGIMVPRENFTEVEDEREIESDRGIDISTLSRTSYYCKLMSDIKRGGREKIPYDEVKEFRQRLFNQSGGNTAFLTPFEFAYLFTFVCYLNGITTIDSYRLLEFIIRDGNNPKYIPLLWNIEYSQGEHYDSSDSLFNAFSLLRYMGYVYPNYDDYLYGTYNIAEEVRSFPNILQGKEAYLPLMEEFVREHFGLTNKAARRKRSIKDIFEKK